MFTYSEKPYNYIFQSFKIDTAPNKYTHNWQDIDANGICDISTC